MFCKTKIKKLPGSDYHEIHRQAFNVYKQIKKKTKRRPYVRSVYFNKDKVFLEMYWHHIYEKENFRDKIRRMKFFPCAIDLIQKSALDPVSKENPNRHSEILHRFFGITENNEKFSVQIREDKRNGQKWLMSVFPYDKTS